MSALGQKQTVPKRTFDGAASECAARIVRTISILGHQWNLPGALCGPPAGSRRPSLAAIVYVFSKLIWECRIIRQFVIEIMTRTFVLAGAVVAVLVTLTNVMLAGANDYVFELVKTEIKSSNVGTIAVRLLHKPSERAVTDAVIVHTRIVMVHEGGTDMNAAFDPLGSPKPGVYAFRALYDGGKLVLVYCGQGTGRARNCGRQDQFSCNSLIILVEGLNAGPINEFNTALFM